MLVTFPLLDAVEVQQARRLLRHRRVIAGADEQPPGGEDRGRHQQAGQQAREQRVVRDHRPRYRPAAAST
jgi:hypothetical protein